MKEKKLFIKMFIVFACFFMLFILSNSQVFASSSKSFTLKSGEKVIFNNFPDEFIYNDYLVFYDKSTKVSYVFNYDASKIFLGSCKIKMSDYFHFEVKPFWLDGSSGQVDGFYPGNYFLSATCFADGTFGNVLTASSVGINSSDFGDNYLSTSDVFLLVLGDDGSYSLDTNNTVFSPAKETILVPIAQSMDFLAVTKEILGILPMILVVLIGLLGLMKAIRQMLKMLHQA